MTEYEFICPECDQQIDVNVPVREATLSHGCPVCGASVSSEHFVEQ
ncbi:transcriptional regulator [Natronococcus pandeyae]|uniref:Transcriptional regulator n=1 Tax=Natronococcus pandeyae TaxID=2055836 RepID=A0A8J8TN70_9EURY|nr:FmdB family zinc ribbon protein [Natronococcus pandeyae]TYL36351.1 transcriptional regulator [Natronococcus pandeyae]